MSFQIPDVSKIDLGKIGGSNRPEPDFIPNLDSSGGRAADRDFFRSVTYNCGISWSAALVWGSLVGGMNGLKNAPGSGYKMKMNGFLNGVGTGSNLANKCGSLAIGYTTAAWVAEQLDLEYNTGTVLSVPAFAGFITGGLYTSFARHSPRAVVLGSVLGAGASCALWIGSSIASSPFK